jgi:branched-chain amino acid transport system ATP-binding protein
MSGGSTAWALELRDLHKSFERTQVLRGVSLAARPGERLALIGPNGAGKSTLFNLVSGRLAPSAGEVWLGGRRIDGMRPYQINRLGLSRSFQITNIFAQLSVRENLRCSVLWSLGYRYTLWRFLADLSDANARVDELLQMIGLGAKRSVRAEHLSYAEQRALEIGITLGSGASVLLLDEPTAGMNRSETARFVELVRTVTADRTLLVVEHDMGVVFDLADRIAVLVQGELIALDTPEAVRANPRVQEAYLGQLPGDTERVRA